MKYCNAMYAGVKTMQKKGEKEPVRLRDILVSAASMGLTLCGSLCIGIACGYWVDTQLGTIPWGLLLGGILGAVSGFWSILKKAVRFMNDHPSR